MRHWLTPDYLLPHYSAVTPDFLGSLGITTLFSDIDNTLAPYEMAEPDGEIITWAESLRAAGISVAVLSNNDNNRVKLFARALGIPSYPNARKPLTKVLRQAMHDIGALPEHSAVLGDQLLTDALVGNRLGLRVLIVPPIKDKTTLFFKCKRAIERPVLRRFRKKHPNEVIQNDQT